MTQPLPLTPPAFEAALRAKGAYYHIHHPYHIAMHNGEATREQIRGWVANRFYYQTSIPIKDAAIMANCPQPETRRKWVQRILDHDGYGGSEGGIEAWLRPGEAVGLQRDALLSEELVLPGVRFAVDAYVNFARRACWQEAACSSLTELFAPQIHQSRLDSWPQHYPWIDAAGYDYFRSRLGGPTAMWNTAWRWRWTIATPLKSSSACWRSCSSNWIFCGACWTP